MDSSKFPKEAKVVYEGPIFKVLNREQELFDGTKTTFEWIQRKPCIAALAEDKEWNFIIIRERQPRKPWFWWIIAWMIESWEDPLEGSKRELEEETGYKFDKIELVAVHDDAGTWSKMESLRYMYFASGWTKWEWQKLDPGEEIEVHIIKREDIKNVIEEKFTNFDKELINKYFKDKLPK